MPDLMLPRYPIYIPSKGRYDTCFTARFLIQDGVPFYLVVEPQEQYHYSVAFGEERLLVLPWSGNDEIRKKFCEDRNIENGGLIAVRNWIKEHSISEGHARHWQLDDNIRWISRRFQSRRIRCNAGVAFRVVEDFVDRYENIAIAGLAYEMFTLDSKPVPPFYLNSHVYSCTLILNSIPYRWRSALNDDTDICLQVLSGGWCTVQMNIFLTQKMRTMMVKGGNTELYQGDGRLKMARSLEKNWPGVVQTKRRFQRPQHVVADAWRKFDTPLKLKPGIDLSSMTTNEYGMELKQVKPEIKSAELRKILADHKQKKDKGLQG
jgi:hypothetical protein